MKNQIGIRLDPETTEALKKLAKSLEENFAITAEFETRITPAAVARMLVIDGLKRRGYLTAQRKKRRIE